MRDDQDRRFPTLSQLPNDYIVKPCQNKGIEELAELIRPLLTTWPGGLDGICEATLVHRVNLERFLSGAAPIEARDLLVVARHLGISADGHCPEDGSPSYRAWANHCLHAQGPIDQVHLAYMQLCHGDVSFAAEILPDRGAESTQFRLLYWTRWGTKAGQVVVRRGTEAEELFVRPPFNVLEQPYAVPRAMYRQLRDLASVNRPSLRLMHAVHELVLVQFDDFLREAEREVFDLRQREHAEEFARAHRER